MQFLFIFLFSAYFYREMHASKHRQILIISLEYYIFTTDFVIYSKHHFQIMIAPLIQLLLKDTYFIPLCISCYPIAPLQ